MGLSRQFGKKMQTWPPVFKKGGRDIAENYRPISQTCVCCKILEHIIALILEIICHCHLINMALGSYILVKPNYLSLYRIFFFIEINLPVDMVILDFSKAFDVVPHRRCVAGTVIISA